MAVFVHNITDTMLFDSAYQHERKMISARNATY